MSCWEVAADVRLALGEGPVWDDLGRCLWFVDIHGGAIQRLDPATGSVEQQLTGRELGIAIPTVGQGLVLAADDGVRLWSWLDRRGELVVPVCADDDNVRLNDGAVDAQGRLLVGTIAKDFRDGVSTLYRIGRGGAAPVVPGLALANGVGWSPDGGVLYLVDSRNRVVEAFDYDARTGDLSGRRTWLSVPAEHGWADGLAVDATGGVWIAMYLHGAVHRYDPDGVLTHVVRLPVTKPTSVCFGGDGHRDLYVTSARFGLSPAELKSQPLAGATLVIPGAGRGLPAARWDPSTLDTM
jgi:sugar lactone lactonase YvrE